MTNQRLGRAPWTTAGPIDDAQSRLRDQICDGWGGGKVGLAPADDAGRLLGPFDLMTVSPQVGGAILGAAESFRDAELSPLERELVILVVAATENVAFMWEGHAPVALAAGLSREAAAAVRAREEPLLDGQLRVVHDVARRLTDNRDLDDNDFNTAFETLGWRRLQEIVWLTGLYQALGLAMRVARTPPPDNEQAIA